jgi:hypothetical protein
MYIRIPLQEPSRFCSPLVTVSPEQKLMKLASSLESISIDSLIRSRGAVDIRGRVGLASGGAPPIVARGCGAGLDGVVRQALVAAVATVVAAVLTAILAAVLATILTAVLATILTTVLAAILTTVLTAVLATVLATILTTTAAEPSTPILSSFEPTGGSVLVDRGRLGSDGQAQEGRNGGFHQHVGRLGERSR